MAKYCFLYCITSSSYSKDDLTFWQLWKIFNVTWILGRCIGKVGEDLLCTRISSVKNYANLRRRLVYWMICLHYSDLYQIQKTLANICPNNIFTPLRLCLEQVRFERNVGPESLLEPNLVGTAKQGGLQGLYPPHFFPNVML